MKIARISAAIVLTAALAACTGCIPHTELDKQAIVEAIGIDRADDGYEVTVQYFGMEGAGGTTLVDNTKANVLTASGSGSSVFAALESASAKCGKRFMFGITNIIVLGEGAADPDLRTVLGFAETHYENNPRLLLAHAEGKAADIMSVKFREQNVSANHLEALLKNAEDMGLCECKRLYDVLEELRRPTGCTLLPRLRPVEDESGVTDDGKTVEIVGGTLFNEGREAGKVPLSAMSGIQLLCGKMKNTGVPASAEGKSVAVTVYETSCRLTPRFEDGKLRFDADIHASGRYADNQLGDEQAMRLSEQAEQSVAELLTGRVESAVRLINENSCDPCGLQYIISSRSYPDWLRLADNFGEALREAEFHTRCEVSIDRFGLTN